MQIVSIMDCLHDLGPLAARIEDALCFLHAVASIVKLAHGLFMKFKLFG